MFTLQEIGPNGLRDRLAEQDLEEMILFHGGGPTDITSPLPGPLGFGGAVTRKTDAAQRWAIDHERHAPLIRSEIWRLYKTDEGRRNVAAQVRTNRNLLKRIADELAVAYERPPVRMFGSQACASAFRDVVIGEGQFNSQAKLWTRHAFLQNVVHVIPQVHLGKLVYDLILPHASDVVFDDGDYDPSILTWQVNGAGFTRVAVDNERFWFLDQNFAPVAEFAHGYRDLSGQPMQPWVAWRAVPRAPTGDYWSRGIGRQLVEATLSIGVAAAGMRHVRQVANIKFATLQTQRPQRDVPAGQVVSTERPLIMQEGELRVHDMIVPVGEFLEQIKADVDDTLESYGIAPTGDTFEDHAKVSRARQRMVDEFERADRETSIKTAIILRADGHPEARRLSPAAVSRGMRVGFVPHSFMQRPRERFAAYVEELRLGLVDQVELRMREHPDEDEVEAEAALRKSIERRNEFNAMLAERNLPADPAEDGETIAQLAGRIGGMMRGGPDGNSNERSGNDGNDDNGDGNSDDLGRRSAGS